jgi:hypothetical protein
MARFVPVRLPYVEQSPISNLRTYMFKVGPPTRVSKGGTGPRRGTGAKRLGNASVALSSELPISDHSNLSSRSVSTVTRAPMHDNRLPVGCRVPRQPYTLKQIRQHGKPRRNYELRMPEYNPKLETRNSKLGTDNL